MNLSEQREKVNRLLMEQSILQKELKKSRSDLAEKQSLYADYFEAREIVTEVIRLTQQNFKDRVEPLVEMAIRSVFEKPYEFKLIFEKKRNQLECRPVVIENGVERTPKNDLGGSVVDIISFALRVILWAIEKPRSRNIMLLDEPFKNIGQQEELLLAGQVLRDVTDDLGLQLIVVTHSPEFAEIADTVYEVSNDGIESKVKMVKRRETKQVMVKKRRQII